MSDFASATISIGGEVPQRLISKLCEAITAEHVALDWGGKHFSPRNEGDLLRACDESGVLCLYDEMAPYGQFYNLEEFLQKHGVSFTRSNNPGSTYDGEIVEFRGQDLHIISTNADGEPFASVSILRSVDELLTGALEHLENGLDVASKLKEAQALLREQLPPEVVPLEPFEIVH